MAGRRGLPALLLTALTAAACASSPSAPPSPTPPAAGAGSGAQRGYEIPVDQLGREMLLG